MAIRIKLEVITITTLWHIQICLCFNPTDNGEFFFWRTSNSLVRQRMTIACQKAAPTFLRIFKASASANVRREQKRIRRFWFCKKLEARRQAFLSDHRILTRAIGNRTHSIEYSSRTSTLFFISRPPSLASWWKKSKAKQSKMNSLFNSGQLPGRIVV